MNKSFNRRTMLKGSVLVAGFGSVAGRGGAEVVPGQDGFAYEVTRTDAEWLARLGESDFGILRQGKTEAPKSSPYWNSADAGQYACKGCDLPLYSSDHKAEVDKGWVFFFVSEPNALLTGIDGPEGAREDPEYANLLANEVHCRRCGSHIGHILLVDGQVLHCVNGASMAFAPVA